MGPVGFLEVAACEPITIITNVYISPNLSFLDSKFILQFTIKLTTIEISVGCMVMGVVEVDCDE